MKNSLYKKRNKKIEKMKINDIVKRFLHYFCFVLLFIFFSYLLLVVIDMMVSFLFIRGIASFLRNEGFTVSGVKILSFLITFLFFLYQKLFVGFVFLKEKTINGYTIFKSILVFFLAIIEIFIIISFYSAVLYYNNFLTLEFISHNLKAIGVFLATTIYGVFISNLLFFIFDNFKFEWKIILKNMLFFIGMLFIINIFFIIFSLSKFQILSFLILEFFVILFSYYLYKVYDDKIIKKVKA